MKQLTRIELSLSIPISRGQSTPRGVSSRIAQLVVTLEGLAPIGGAWTRIIDAAYEASESVCLIPAGSFLDSAAEARLLDTESHFELWGGRVYQGVSIAKLDRLFEHLSCEEVILFRADSERIAAIVHRANSAAPTIFQYSSLTMVGAIVNSQPAGELLCAYSETLNSVEILGDAVAIRSATQRILATDLFDADLL